MQILLLGNGFDLEHDLPTQYKSFLEFSNLLSFTNNWDYYNASPTCKSDSSSLNEYILSLQSDNEKGIYFELHECILDNYWINYFQSNNNDQKTWIDFESEISQVIKQLDEAKKHSNDHLIRNRTSATPLPDYPTKFIRALKLSYVNTNCFATEIVFFDRIKTRLLDDLNKLIRALEIYLCDYVEKLPVSFYNPDVFELTPHKILSFNYTNTYNQNYAIHNPDIEYEFIHGKADIQASRFSSNLVLGIDEYLEGNAKNNNTDFIQFKKFFQRIHKKTGSRYKDWLEEINASSTPNSPEHHLYVFGHSLDVTDKDIIQDFLLNDKITTTIFYYDDATYAKIIENLVKVITADELIARVYGHKKNIIFRHQSPKEEIKGSSFEIISDINKLHHLSLFSHATALDVINKIEKKISTKDVSYFVSQENIIWLFDAFECSNYNNHKNDLLEIASSLPKKNPDTNDYRLFTSYPYYIDVKDSDCSESTYGFFISIDAQNPMPTHKSIKFDLDNSSKLDRLIYFQNTSNLSSDYYTSMLQIFLDLYFEDNFDIHKLQAIMLDITKNNENVSCAILKTRIDSFDFSNAEHYLDYIQLQYLLSSCKSTSFSCLFQDPSTD